MWVREGVGKKPAPSAKQPLQALYLRTTLTQLLLVAIVFPPVYTGLGRAVAISLLCGAVCALLPQGFFALRMAAASRHSAARAARLALLAQGGKFLLGAALFALVFAVIQPARPGLVFLGFGALWLVQSIGAIRLLKAQD